MELHQMQPPQRYATPAAPPLGRTSTLEASAWERGHPARIGLAERARGPAPAAVRSRGQNAAPPRPRSQDTAPEWLVYAAPFSVAVLWAGITGASLLLFAVTGRRELLDACRSGSVLLSTGALAVAALVVASVRNGWRVRP